MDDLYVTRPDWMDGDTWEAIKRQALDFIGDQVSRVLTTT